MSHELNSSEGGEKKKRRAKAVSSEAGVGVFARHCAMNEPGLCFSRSVTGSDREWN